MFMPSLSSLIGTTFLIVLFAGGYRLLHGQMSLGALITFNTYLNQLVWPMIALGWVTNIFQRGAASMGRLNYILEAKPQIDDRGAKIASSTPVNGQIEFRNLTFTYPTAIAGNGANGASSGTGKPVLKNINLKIPAGSTLAIVGPTGSGKSTLAALIARLWEAPPGALLIDGRSIREYPLEELRRCIGYVPQDTFLFSETIRENIAFGVSDAVEEHIFEATEIASISGEIQSFPQRFDT